MRSGVGLFHEVRRDDSRRFSQTDLRTRAEMDLKFVSCTVFYEGDGDS